MREDRFSVADRLLECRESENPRSVNSSSMCEPLDYDGVGCMNLMARPTVPTLEQLDEATK